MIKTKDGYVIENEQGEFLNGNMEWEKTEKINAPVCDGPLDDIKRLIVRCKIPFKRIYEAKRINGQTLISNPITDLFTS